MKTKSIIQPEATPVVADSADMIDACKTLTYQEKLFISSVLNGVFVSEIKGLMDEFIWTSQDNARLLVPLSRADNGKIKRTIYVANQMEAEIVDAINLDGHDAYMGVDGLLVLNKLRAMTNVERTLLVAGVSLAWERNHAGGFDSTLEAIPV